MLLLIFQGEDNENRSVLVAALKEISADYAKKNEPVVAIGISDYIPRADSDVASVFERADQKMYMHRSKLKTTTS